MLYKNNIIHGELQPCDVFINRKSEPLICNYGIIEKNPKAYKAKITAATELFLAPELYNTANGANTNMTKSTDIYAYAMLIFRIHSKKNVFEKNANQYSFADNIINGLRLKIPTYIYIHS